MPLPVETLRLLETHRFEVEPKIAPREACFNRADLISMGKNQLIDTFLELQDRNDKLISCLENMLRAKHTQAELLTSIEQHLDIPPQLTESYHQSVALDHALTWMEVYNPDSDFLIDISKNQSPVTTNRLKFIREHIRNGGSVDSSPFTSSTTETSTELALTPHTFCKHVLHTDIKRFPRNSFTIGYNNPERPLHQLTLDQIAHGMSIREFINSYDDDSCPERDDNEFWRRMEDELLEAINTPEMSPTAWNSMWFFAAWFRCMRSGHFETQRLRFLQEEQREAREKIANNRAVPMICNECRAEKVEENEVASRLVEAEGKLFDWWKDNKEEIDNMAERILQKFKIDDRNEAKRRYDFFARSMNTYEGSFGQASGAAYAPGPAHATGLGIYKDSSSGSSSDEESRVAREFAYVTRHVRAQQQQQQQQQQGSGYSAAMPSDDSRVPGRYTPEFQPDEIRRLMGRSDSRGL